MHCQCTQGPWVYTQTLIGDYLRKVVVNAAQYSVNTAGLLDDLVNLSLLAYFNWDLKDYTQFQCCYLETTDNTSFML